MYYSKIKLDIIYDCFVGINGGNRKSVGIFIDMENKSPINFGSSDISSDMTIMKSKQP